MSKTTKHVLNSLMNKEANLILPMAKGVAGFQFFNGQQPTLIDLKQNLHAIGQHITKIDTEITAKAMDTQTSRDEIQKLQEQKADMQARFDVLKEQHDQFEAEQKAKFTAQQQQMQATIGGIEDPKAKVTAAKAELIRATLRNQAPSTDALAALGDNTNPATGGEKFLPKTVSNQIITEPYVKNPLRDIVTVTNITNLEVPKLLFTLDDDDFIADTATAKELKATGDTVQFGRHKFKVFVGISETVLHGTDANLVAHVDKGLESGVASKEKKVMFAETPKAGEEHMSFYSTQNDIKKVSGNNTYAAIKAALADLHEDYRENAKVVMTYGDYLEMVEALSNGNISFYGVQPETFFGKPIIFTDSATKPVVGDFNYSHINYDLKVLYDRDKDVRTGVELFVITAWLDHQIKLKSAFRIAEVVATP